MFSFVFFLALATVNQGQAAQIVYPDQPGLEAIQIEWQNSTIPFVRAGSQWLCVLGVDLEMMPGRHPAKISLTFNDGRVEGLNEEIDVREKSFPTTELQVENRFVQLSARDQRRADREAEEIRAIYATITPEMLWNEPFRVPIAGRQGTNFGHRRIFNGQPSAPHSGADLRATTGTRIRATNRGRVVLAKPLFFSGNTVILDHGLGIYSLYAHLSAIQIKRGTIIERGQLVGLAGATGRVTGPHLHWGARVRGARVDPFSLVELLEQKIP